MTPVLPDDSPSPAADEAEWSRSGTLRSWMIVQVSRVLLGRRSLPAQLAVATLAVLLAFGIRLSVDDLLPAGFPFLTFFPAVLITAIFASVAMGVVAAVVSGVLAWVFFIPPFNGLSLAPSALLAMAFYAVITAVELFFIALSASALRHVQAERMRSLQLAKSRDLMFAELQHRVSNNLATVGALLRAQAARVDSEDAKQALLDSMQRLNTVARIQRDLHAPEAQAIETRAFLNRLSADIAEAFGRADDVRISVEADKFRIPAEKAVPFGLVAGEMIMNALEHAQPAEGLLRIDIHGKVEGLPETGYGRVSLRILDNGQGLRTDPENERDANLGVSIAQQFARTLEGTLTLANRPDGPGAEAALSFPLAMAGQS
jgi:two-component system, sensor histidine kinase PdtaS